MQAPQTQRTIEPGAWYRLAETFSTPARRGLVPVGKTWLYEQISAGRLATRKIGGRATVVSGTDLLRLFGGAE